MSVFDGPRARAHTRTRILLIDEDPYGSRNVIQTLVQGDPGYELLEASSLEGALKEVSACRPDVLVVDLALRDGAAGRAFQRLRSAAPDPAIIVLAERADEETAVRALQEGAQDYLVRDELSPDLLERAIRYAVERQRLLLELRSRVADVEAEDARFRTIIQTTTDALVIVDHVGAVRFVNAAAEHLFGRPARELLGKPFGLPVVVGETTEVDIVRPGSTIVAELRASEIDWEGAPAAIASLRDITERKRAEERERTLIREQVARVEAEASERRARFLAEVGSALAESLDYNLTLKRLARLAVPFLGDWCVVDVIEEDGSIRRVAVDCADPAHSDLAADIKALPTEHNVLLGVSRILRDRRGELIAELTPEHIERLSAVPERAELIHRITPNSAMVVPLVARGRPLGAILLASAQSQRTYKDRDLEFAEEVAWRAAIAVDNARLYQEAQLANKAKADFLAIMSHELRTPLNAVIGYSDLLLMGVPAEIPTTAVGHVDRIRGSARHLLRLIEEILTYARMEAGREQLDIQEFDSEAVIRDVIALIEPLALDRKLELVCRLPDHQVTLRSDPGKLQQILLNLLSNAVKFTDNGEVGLEFKVEGQTAQFVVWDTGIGLSPESARHIFEPFWQAEQSRTRRAEGTGLGLTVARSLANLLGGDLELDSEIGQGTRFTLHIPARVMLPRDPAEARPNLANSPPSRSQSIDE
jgi:signal transduction histidine kinase/DNA-binding NarL/FixJ family response regulator